MINKEEFYKIIDEARSTNQLRRSYHGDQIDEMREEKIYELLHLANKYNISKIDSEAIVNCCFNLYKLDTGYTLC